VINVEKFWEFMIERESIRLRRLEGRPQSEWSTDPIFQYYSFTNVKRVHDRTTTLLKREFYDQHLELQHPSPVALLNSAIFRYHGTIETARALGWRESWDTNSKDRMVLLNEARMDLGETVFTAAYIVPNCGSVQPKHEIVAVIVSSIWDAADRILDTDTWAEACNRLCQLWGVGSFMAKEILLDYILATRWCPSDWTTWTPVGPGGRRGAGYVKYDVIKGIGESEALEVIRSVYEDRAKFWPENFVELELTDIQFQFCEVAKYMKAKRGTGKPKRKFKPHVDNVTRSEP
jgi:hypothetical protein